MLSRLVYGGRMSLLMGLAPVALATSFGGFLGVVAGFAGGWVNMLIMRTMDVFYAFRPCCSRLRFQARWGAAWPMA